MMLISLIAAMDERRGLGKENQLLCHLPADLKHFKHLTMAKPIIMGRNTFNSIGKPLPGRRNVVLTSQELNFEGVEVVHSLEQAFELTSGAPEVMIIGGATVYQQTLAFASRLYLTVIHHQFKADVFFPELDSSWECREKTFRPKDENNLYDMTFCVYERT
ncbi:dihydrofolate reductase [Legionella jordanis]|uniref:dihydrofolate reductase n=1 Tax=Legionella jordanis TaxID=456 RepID=UPI000EFDCA7D|nr:dihydrofolate reductase [Legionella jordanis]RMX21777.1 dihydrofolate reductase [Legionella jordanis]